MLKALVDVCWSDLRLLFVFCKHWQENVDERINIIIYWFPTNFVLNSYKYVLWIAFCFSHGTAAACNLPLFISIYMNSNVKPFSCGKFTRDNFTSSAWPSASYHTLSVLWVSLCSISVVLYSHCSRWEGCYNWPLITAPVRSTDELSIECYK